MVSQQQLRKLAKKQTNYWKKPFNFILDNLTYFVLMLIYKAVTNNSIFDVSLFAFKEQFLSVLARRH